MLVLNESVLKNTYKNQISDTLRIDYIVNKTTESVLTDATATMVKTTTTNNISTDSRVGSGTISVISKRMFFGIENYPDLTVAERSSFITTMLSDFETLIS